MSDLYLLFIANIFNAYSFCSKFILAFFSMIMDLECGGNLFFIIVLFVITHAKMSHLSVKTYSCFITYSNRAHTEQKYDTSMPSIFTLFPEI